MRYLLTNIFVWTATALSFAQDSTSYRATPTKVNDLVHTKLDVRFDYDRCFLYGKEWVTLRPHGYPTDSLRLDAKGMDIHALSLVRNGALVPLKYQYTDSLSLAVQLDKTYKVGEQYTVFIDYTAKPNQIKQHGSQYITDAKGLYFINPDGKDKSKPVQIWTQGETESSSCWFPTIDKPNQKTTEEISMTVPGRFVTLSNGRLAAQRKNADGTRTDTWKMELPHAPYLFMMAVGDFKIYHDHWRNKPVDYYLEPKYAPYAKDIFGKTPEMMEYFSKTLGVDFPWNKYAQVVVRDYVSGAMENTTATLHGPYVQETARELLDANYDFGQCTIAHELFHQWFGDYVTCESWSNLTVNESFADFSESLWAEHKFGKDEGDAHRYETMQGYLHTPGADQRDLVRFFYKDREDMFDPVTYNKGGQILYMLRNYLGDGAFFKGLQLYLKANAFGNGGAQQLRLALEQASGKDLNWFFNEWYYGAGHPVLDISYAYQNHTERVIIGQQQAGPAFALPMAVDIYAGGKKDRHAVWLKGKADTLYFTTAAEPELVNVDADKMLLCQKNDHKTLEAFAFQYDHAPLYLDRLEAIDTALAHSQTEIAKAILLKALRDPYYGLRLHVLQGWQGNAGALSRIIELAKNDPNTLVKAAALTQLGLLRSAEYRSLFDSNSNSASYAVQGAALNGILALDPRKGYELAKRLEKDNEGALTAAIVQAYLKQGSEANWAFVFENYGKQDAQSQYNGFSAVAGMIAKDSNAVDVNQGIDLIKDFAVKFKASHVAPSLTGLLKQIAAQRKASGDTSGSAYAERAIESVNENK